MDTGVFHISLFAPFSSPEVHLPPEGHRIEKLCCELRTCMERWREDMDGGAGTLQRRVDERRCRFISLVELFKTFLKLVYISFKYSINFVHSQFLFPSYALVILLIFIVIVLTFYLVYHQLLLDLVRTPAWLFTGFARIDSSSCFISVENVAI